MSTVTIDYWIQDCSAATLNLLLEAEYLGSDAVALGIYPITERQQRLGLPAEVIPLGAVVLGYPESHPEPMDTFRNMIFERTQNMTS